MPQVPYTAAVITGACLLVYLRYLLLFARALRRPEAQEAHGKPTVSVGVAARNEAANLPLLLTALVNQSYPQALYEVIVADDASTDGTADVVRQFTQRWPLVKLVDVQNRTAAISPKKNALSQAIAAGNGEIILTTDADCLVGRHWIAAMVACFTPDVHMVVGYSRTMLSNWRRATLVQKFEHFDFHAMFMAAAGAIAAGKAFSCSGQNLAYRRTAFEQVGGFSRIAHILSGDDVNLMQLMRRMGLRVRFAFSRHAFAGTRPVRSWRQLFNQRSRWAGNMRRQLSLNPEFFFYLFATALLFVGALALLLLCWPLGAGVLAIKAAGEYAFLAAQRKRFEMDGERLRFFPVWFVLQPFYLLPVAMLGQLNLFRWHGRR